MAPSTGQKRPVTSRKERDIEPMGPSLSVTSAAGATDHIVNRKMPGSTHKNRPNTLPSAIRMVVATRGRKRLQPTRSEACHCGVSPW